MWKFAGGVPEGVNGSGRFLAFLNRLRDEPHPQARDFLSGEGTVVVARAPGRLDVMGGIADYSGALVLQLPLALATWCAVQRRSDSRFRIISASPDEERCVELDWHASGTEAAELDAARRFFAASPQTRWSAYVLGILTVWKDNLNFDPPCGLDIAIHSEVPEGSGISSSAALEVSTASAMAEAYEIERDPVDLALDCQRVENHIVGAACGAMDQITATSGRSNRLLQLLCQPAEIRGHLEVPKGLGLWGIDSGVRHSVAGTAYESVRVGAFMGHRILAEATGLKTRKERGRVRVLDDPWRGYLANISPDELHRFVGDLPAEMRGAEFLGRYHGTIDAVTRVDPERSYPVRNATIHPIYEQSRIETFASLLGEAQPEAVRLGQLMYESHESYGACGLGCAETDRIVELARKASESGIYGAKITGGGSGGTVALLGREGAEDAVRRIASDYGKQVDREPRVYSGSSPGASTLGCLELQA